MKRFHIQLTLLLIAGLIAPALQAHAATLTVNATADNTTMGDGFCTLREAVQEASLTTGAGPFECGAPSIGGSDTIVFDAAVAGGTFTLINPLYLSFDDAIIIEGADSIVDGSGLGLAGVAFIVQSAQNEVRDLLIQGANTGIEVQSTASGTVLGGPTPATRLQLDDNTTFGIRIDGANDTTLRFTRIADSNANIQIEANSDTVRVRDSLIGLDSGGVASALDYEQGIVINGGSAITIRHNIISDNGFAIFIRGGDAIKIRGNYIGTNLAGDAPLDNSTGITIDGTATNVQIGGRANSASNLISGSLLAIAVLRVNDVEIVGNRIGTDASVTNIIENGSGINLNGALNTVIDSNVISGQRLQAIYVDNTSSATITGNLIGTNASLADLPNAQINYSVGLWISGEATLVQNTIAFHDAFPNSVGIKLEGGGSILSGSVDNCISGNSIGLQDDSTGDINLGGNYWGDPSGPTILPSGTVFGDSVEEVNPSGLLDYASFLTSSPVVCP